MTIQEAINHAKEVAEKKYAEGMLCNAKSKDDTSNSCIKCAKAHEQLVEWLEELQQYREIGTVEEYQEAMERQRAKKPKKVLDETNHFYRYYCPVCGRYFGNDKIHNGTFLFKEIYCQEEKCGQAIDWSETE